MSTLKFRFYPPKKQQDINLVPDSTIVGASALVAKSCAAKKKKNAGKCNEMLPPFGPTQAIGFDGDMSGNYGGDARGPGYGNSDYGARAYGEALDKIKKTNARKAYTLYNTSLKMCENFE